MTRRVMEIGLLLRQQEKNEILAGLVIRGSINYLFLFS